MENVLERALIRARGSSRLTSEHIELPENGLRPSTGCAPDSLRPGEPSGTGRLRDVERRAIAEALSACRGNIKQAAVRLGIARNTLYRKMQEFGLEAGIR